MIWHDVLVRLPLDDQELVRALAAGFGVNPDQVLVYRGADDFVEPGGAKVVCVVRERAEGFKNVLFLHTYFDAPRKDDPITVMKEFAKVARTDCLVSDDSPNPYTMINILPNGDVASVNLDEDQLDDKDEYHIRAAI